MWAFYVKNYCFLGYFIVTFTELRRPCTTSGLHLLLIHERNAAVCHHVQLLIW